MAVGDHTNAVPPQGAQAQGAPGMAGENDKVASGSAPMIKVRWPYRVLAGIERGIGARLLVRVVLFSSAITLILTLLQLYLDYQHDVHVIERRLAEIEQSYLDSIGESLWKLDERQLLLQLEGILRLPDVRAVEVRELIQRTDPLVVQVGQRQSHSVLAREIPIIHPVRGAMQPIGTLYVEATLTEVYRALMNKAFVILISQGTKTFLVSLFIVYIFHRLVTRHLTSIAGALRSYDLTRPAAPLSLRRQSRDEPDELDHVVSAFNSVSAQLRGAYDKQRKGNLELERDIATRRRTEGALRESEHRFRDFAETASDWFWETSPDHRFTYVSERAVDFGFDPVGLIGRHRWDAATDLEDESEKWHRHFRALEWREPFRQLVYRIKLQDGSDGFAETSGKPVFDNAGGFLGYRGVGRDMTSAVRAEMALRDAKEQAELASRAKSSFLANMSHELRTPLNAIIGLSEMIKAEILGPVGNAQYRGYAGDINTSGQHLLGIINEVLDLAKVEAGKMELDLRVVNLGEITTDVLRILKAQAESAGLTLENRITPDLPRIHADSQALRRILFNLLSNAIKFTPSGGTVTVGLCQAPTREIELSIADTGIGIAAENIPKLMQPFVQLDSVYERKFQGTGLGLAMVRSLVERHGGTVNIESETGRGTHVMVRLPAHLVVTDQMYLTGN